MANTKTLYEVIGRAILDRTFRAALLQDPAGTCRSGGYGLSDPQIRSLAKLTAGGLQQAMTSLIGYTDPTVYAHGDPHVSEWKR